MEKKQEILRSIPKIDELLLDEQLVFFMESTPRAVVVDAARELTDRVRNEILSGERVDVPGKREMVAKICDAVTGKKKRNLRKLINATGVVLHTNLGRANLCKTAVESMLSVADSYSNLEYDVKKGARGSRHDHVEKIIAQITGAEAAMVVNNNAAATMLCLSAMALGKEVIVSRGELVEIGGSFRIPEIMEQSGAHLKDVGTTNKTKPSDYRNAYDEEKTGALMKVHTSNYRIVGFTQEVTLKEMAEMGKELHLPVIYDMGSGLMVNLERFGVDEPTVLDALKDGADVVLFSGDKLLGGPQGGIIIGKKEYVDRMKKHPLARAFRVDKLTLAAMEATFFEYLDPESAKRTIPVLKMITAGEEELGDRAWKLKNALEKRMNMAEKSAGDTDTAGDIENSGNPENSSNSNNFEKTGSSGFEFGIVNLKDQIGGGSAPTVLLSGKAVSVCHETIPAERMERLLRKYKIPLIVRVAHDKIYLSVRTIRDEEIDVVADAFAFVKEQAESMKGE